MDIDKYIEVAEKVIRISQMSGGKVECLEHPFYSITRNAIDFYPGAFFVTMVKQIGVLAMRNGSIVTSRSCNE